MRVQLTTVIAAISLAVSVPALAQDQAPSNQLAQIVRSGDWITVTDTSGRNVFGEVSVLSDSSVTLLVGRSATPRSFDMRQVTQVQRRHFDSLTNGAVWGLLGGGAAGFLWIQGVSCSGCTWDPPSVPALVTALGAGIGAGVGVGLDALFKQQRVIYTRAPSPSKTVRAVPLWDRTRKGALLSIGF